ncbi:hypothetical protein B296_00009705 [Ensete ventricosum]|uniref:Uncharacterized protein n=1 Tax=Ensete ventricosum TaxID=4639 RepID=A0A427AGF9_ENSVE|nr:hypothetical protein B296_00009705 [Ensete ventricosum]
MIGLSIAVGGEIFLFFFSVMSSAAWALVSSHGASFPFPSLAISIWYEVLLLRFGSRPILVVATATKECFTTNDLCFANRPLLLSSQHFSYNGTTVAVQPAPHCHHSSTLPARLCSFTPLHGANVRSLLRSLNLLRRTLLRASERQVQVDGDDVRHDCGDDHGKQVVR